MSIAIVRAEVLPHLQRVKPDNGGYRASCPVPSHGKGMGDRIPSFTVGAGDTQPVVFKCHAGCEQPDIKEALVSLGVDWDKVSAKSDRPNRDDDYIACGWDGGAKRHDWSHRKVAEYPYHYADGALSFAVARCGLKGVGCQGFRQWRPDPAKRSGKTWTRRLADGTKVGEGLPYRLPAVRRAIGNGQTIWICEGEADCDRLSQSDIVATCNAEGSGKWTPAHAQWLEGADVVVVGDRDEPGWRHAEHVVDTLLDLAVSIEFVRAAEGKDARDHLDAGLTVRQFVTIDVPKAYVPAAVVIDLAPRLVAA